MTQVATQPSVANKISSKLTDRLTSRRGTGRRGRGSRLSAYMSYFAVVAVILSVVSVGYQAPNGASDNSGNSLARSSSSTAESALSLDQVAAAELAATAAAAADLSIANNVSNLSISLNAKSELAQTDDALLTKSHIVQVNGGGRGMREYKANAGDTVQAVAAKYGVSPETIKWANNLNSDAINAGKTLRIPSVDGVVYTVKAGDSPESLALKYKTDSSRIVSYNDAEISGLQVGSTIVLPGGVLPNTERPGYQAPARQQSYSYGYLANASASVGNRYSYGYCTWYAYNRRAELGRPIGSFWGDAITWKSYAQSAGFDVNRTPKPGAVLHDPNSAPPYGHVAVVESVADDGSITVSEMNYVGWNRISYRTISAGEVSSYSYIH